MAYKNAVNNILKYKKQWEDATNSGDTTKANSAAEGAKAYYDSLRNNGYGQVADNLSSKNYSESEKYVKDFLGTTGRQAIRPYLYSKGAQYGLTQADIDKNLSYNQLTGEVSYGGMNLGKPAYETDGVSYWDADTLDSVWDKIVSNNGYTKTDANAYAQKRDEVMGQQSESFDIIKQNAQNYNKQNAAFVDMARNDNPLDTEWGKGIMDYYNWQGGKAADNATASSAATNGGNVDSFAAANAARQQLAYTNSGIASVTDQFANRLAAVQSALEGLSANNYQMESSMRDSISQGMTQAQQAFDNDQTSKNNEQARKNSETERLATVAGVTGYIPDEFLKAENPLFDPKTGELLNPDMDYEATVVQPALKVLNDPNASEAQKAAAQRMYNFGQQAKIYKTQNYSQYKQYANTVGGYMPEATAAMRDADAQRVLEKYLGDLGYKSAIYQTDQATNAAIQEAQQEAAAAQAAAYADMVAAQQDYNAKIYATNAENGLIGEDEAIKVTADGIVNNENENVTLTDAQFQSALDSAASADAAVNLQLRQDGKIPEDTKDEVIAKIITAVQNNPNLTGEQALKALERMGISKDMMEAAASGPRR